jgi:hypothetical protein
VLKSFAPLAEEMCYKPFRDELLPHKKNTEVAKELNITPLFDKIQDYKIKWIQHVNRMPRNKLPRLIKKTTPHKPKEPLKRLMNI